MMGDLEYIYFWNNLEALDPDQLVCDLELRSSEILAAFPQKARAFIEREHG